MYRFTLTTQGINLRELLRAGYEFHSLNNYIYQIDRWNRFHATFIGNKLKLHKDKTVKGLHIIALSNLDKEIKRIKLYDRR